MEREIKTETQYQGCEYEAGPERYHARKRRDVSYGEFRRSERIDDEFVDVRFRDLYGRECQR